MPLCKFPTPTPTSGNPQAPSEGIHQSSGTNQGLIWGARKRPKMNPTFPRFVRNKITYTFIARCSNNLISLKINGLENPGRKRGELRGPQEMKVCPTMLLKTHGEKMSILCLPTMLMKNKGVNRFLPRCSRKNR